MDLTTLRNANRQRHVEWTKGNDIPLSFRGLELAEEVGEACNELKKLERFRMGRSEEKRTSKACVKNWRTS